MHSLFSKLTMRWVEVVTGAAHVDTALRAAMRQADAPAPAQPRPKAPRARQAARSRPTARSAVARPAA